MLVIDEFMAAYRYDLIPKEEAIEFLEKKPKELEIVLTGRNPDEKLIELADYVSEIKKVKHPFDQESTREKGLNIDEGNRKNKIGTSDGIYDRKLCGSGGKSGSRDVIVGEEIRQVRLLTPKGIELYLELEEIMRKKSEVSCAVRKYSGDDPDVTNGILVYATVQKFERQIKGFARTVNLLLGKSFWMQVPESDELQSPD